MRRVGYVERMGKRKGAYSVVVVKPAGKSKLGRSKRRWDAVTEMDLQDVRWRIMDSLDLSGSQEGHVAFSCKCGNEVTKLH